MNKFYKNKEELDVLSDDELQDYRFNFITKHLRTEKNRTRNVDDDQYLSEFEIYVKIRQKDKTIDTYNRYVKAEEDKDYTRFDEDAVSFISSIIKRVGTEYMYNMTLHQNIGDINGIFKTIIGLDIPEKID